MTKRKTVKALFFPLIAALSFAAPQREASADSFLNPADNAFSLKKIFGRPFLQSVPIPQVWQTDSTSEKFRNDWADASTPLTPAERQLKALSWQMLIQDDLFDFKKTAKTDPVDDWKDVAHILNDMVPIVGQAGNRAAFDADRQDILYAHSLMRQSERETDKMGDRLNDLQAFLASLKETARTDLEAERMAALLNAADRKTDKMFGALSRSMLTENILEKTQDIYSSETRRIQGLKETDDVFASLLVNDMTDLSTGTVILSGEEALPGPVVEMTSRSSSLLDRAEKTEQIHKGDPVSRKKAFFKRFEKFLKGDRTKDVK